MHFTGIKLVLIFLLLDLCLNAHAQQNPLPANDPIKAVEDSLRLKKLSLEVATLESEKRYYKYTKPLTVLGSIFGVLTIVWTIYQGIRTIKSQQFQQTQNAISALLGLLYDEKPEKRANGANGLTRYPSKVYPEVIHALKNEQIEYVRELMENILFKLPEKEFGEVLTANRETIQNRSRLLGSFGATEEKIEKTEALLGIYPETRKRITSDFRYFYDQGLETARYQLYRALQIGEQSPTYKDSLISEALQAARIAYSTSRIISRRLRATHELIDLSGLDINLANFYRLHLPGRNFTRSIVTNSICRHADLTGSNFTECNFNKADMYDCILTKSTFRDALFCNVSLRNSKLDYIGVVRTLFVDSILSQSTFTYSIFEEADFRNAKLRGCKFRNSVFKKCHFNTSESEGADFLECQFEECQFFGGKFKAANFNGASFNNCKFNGAELMSAYFANTTITNSDFSGADLKNINTDNWKIDKVVFHKVKNSSLGDKAPDIKEA